MKQFKLYMEDEQGQRLLVGSYDPSELLNLNASSLEELGIDAAKTAESLLKTTGNDPQFWRKKQREQTLAGMKIAQKDLLSDYDILVKWLNYSPEEAEEIICRKKMQRLEELKLKVMAENPTCCFGIAIPEEKHGTYPKAT